MRAALRLKMMRSKMVLRKFLKDLRTYGTQNCQNSQLVEKLEYGQTRIKKDDWHQMKKILNS